MARALKPTVLEEKVDKATNIIYLSLIATICCSLPLGLIALIFSMLALNSAHRGDARKSRKELRLAKIFYMAALVVGFVLICIVAMYTVYVAHLMHQILQPPGGDMNNPSVDGQYYQGG